MGLTSQNLICGALVLAVTVLYAGANFSDLSGSFCRSRLGGCCAGRVDKCTVPIAGTLCYCDEFCNATAVDCCPDYSSFCLGISPPQTIKQCYHSGRYFNTGDEIRHNCNKCYCQQIDNELKFVCERNECLIEPDILQVINNNKEIGWQAANYSMFWGRTLDEGLKLRTGTLQPQKTVKKMMPIVKRYDPSRLPRRFDARNKWPGLIVEPWDQGWCGASWAMSTAAVASDRFAVMSRGSEKVRLSAQHLLSCNNRGQKGCNGGYLSRAWIYMRKFGVVDEDCYPWTGTATRCRLPKKSTLMSANCRPLPSHHTLRTELYKVGPAYRIKTEQDIMDEIVESGPVQATMMVYQDFFAYKSGVYRKSKLVKNRFGYHSVRIIGWGEQPDLFGHPIKYWLVSNSWGPYWGEDGYFKIQRGTNECEIEEFVLASWAYLTEGPNHKYFSKNGNGKHDNSLPNSLNRFARRSRKSS